MGDALGQRIAPAHVPKTIRPVDEPARPPDARTGQQVEKGGGLASREDEDVERLDLARRPHLDRPRHRRDVGREVALQSEDADPHYQPRLANTASGGSFEISRPGIASPSSADTSASTFASL